MMTNHYTQENIADAINGEDPRQAMGMVLDLFQRFVVAIETIADQGKPQTLINTAGGNLADEYKGSAT